MILLLAWCLALIGGIAFIKAGDRCRLRWLVDLCYLLGWLCGAGVLYGLLYWVDK